jgi:hypothetical protein
MEPTMDAAAAAEIVEDLDVVDEEEQAGSSAKAAGKKPLHPSSKQNLGPKPCNAVQADGSRCEQQLYPRLVRLLAPPGVCHVCACC